MKSNSILVSILIPCYNVSIFVEKAITSILSQTYTNLEIWIIDDASTDDTLQKILAFKDERINVVSLRYNTQKIDAVNQVLQKVSGDLIAFQDADDWSEKSRIEKQVNEFINDSNLGVCFTNYFYEGNKKGYPERIALSDSELKDEFFYFLRRLNIHFSPTICPSMMISKTAIEKTGGYNPYFKGRVAEDIQWVYRILKTFSGITVNERLYHYNVRDTSLTGIQSSGGNAKAAYSWNLLAKIIHKDIHENIDVFSPENQQILNAIELEACEEVLVENIKLAIITKKNCEKSWNFKLGKLLLTPLRFLKK